MPSQFIINTLSALTKGLTQTRHFYRLLKFCAFVAYPYQVFIYFVVSSIYDSIFPIIVKLIDALTVVLGYYLKNLTTRLMCSVNVHFILLTVL